METLQLLNAAVAKVSAETSDERLNCGGIMIKAHDRKTLQAFVDAVVPILTVFDGRGCAFITGDTRTVIVLSPTVDPESELHRLELVLTEFNKQLIEKPMSHYWLYHYRESKDFGGISAYTLPISEDRDGIADLIRQGAARDVENRKLEHQSREAKARVFNYTASEWIDDMTDYLHANWHGFEDRDLTHRRVSELMKDALHEMSAEGNYLLPEVMREFILPMQKKAEFLKGRQEKTGLSSFNECSKLIAQMALDNDDFLREELCEMFCDTLQQSWDELKPNLHLSFKTAAKDFKPRGFDQAFEEVVERRPERPMPVEKPFAGPTAMQGKAMSFDRMNSVWDITRGSQGYSGGPLHMLMYFMASHFVDCCITKHEYGFGLSVEVYADQLGKDSEDAANRFDGLMEVIRNTQPTW